MERPRRSVLRVVRHVLEYTAVLGIREIFRYLPPDAAVALGGRIGAFYARARGPRSGDAAINLGLAFPEWSDAERARALEASFANLGRFIAELCLLQGPMRERLLAGMQVEGLENYEAALRSSTSGGVIALSAHFGSWELAGVLMGHLGVPVSVVRHGVRNPWLDRMLTRWRSAAEIEEIEMGRAALGVFRALSRGRVVTVLLDQNAHADEGIFAPFFAHPALTRSGPALLAMSRGVVVLPVFCFRVGESARHIVKVQAPLELESGDSDPEGALERNVARMNAAIEDAIRQAPDHWLWPHRRFKTRPEGETPVYPPRRSRRKMV